MNSIQSAKDPLYVKVASDTKKVIEGGSKLEKILKLVAAVLKPFKTIPILPFLPLFLESLEKGCSQSTEISGGLKVFARPDDWLKRKWKQSGVRGFVQLTAFTGAQVLTTIRLIFKYALLILPSPISIVRDSLFIASFTLLTVDEGKRLRKISNQMSKISTKLNATDDQEKTRLTSKLKRLESLNSPSKDIVKKIEKTKLRFSQVGKDELKEIRAKKVKLLSSKKSDSWINIAFNISMIALSVFSIIATFFLISQPYVLIGLAIVGVAAAALGVVKAFRKDD